MSIPALPSLLVNATIVDLRGSVSLYENGYFGPKNLDMRNVHIRQILATLRNTVVLIIKFKVANIGHA